MTACTTSSGSDPSEGIEALRCADFEGGMFAELNVLAEKQPYVGGSGCIGSRCLCGAG